MYKTKTDGKTGKTLVLVISAFPTPNLSSSIDPTSYCGPRSPDSKQAMLLLNLFLAEKYLTFRTKREKPKQHGFLDEKSIQTTKKISRKRVAPTTSSIFEPYINIDK